MIEILEWFILGAVFLLWTVMAIGAVAALIADWVRDK